MNLELLSRNSLFFAVLLLLINVQTFKYFQLKTETDNELEPEISSFGVEEAEGGGRLKEEEGEQKADEDLGEALGQFLLLR